MARVLMPIPSTDFDPTESAIPWRILREAGHEVVASTPDGRAGTADPRMLSGEGLGVFRPVLIAAPIARAAYAQMAADPAFASPVPWAEARAADFDALLLPGGHAPGMRPYIDSPEVHALVCDFFDADKHVAAICHGVLVAARARRDGRSVLHGRRTTALLRSQELLAWRMTRRRLGDYYRTYPVPVQDEVTAALASPDHFEEGPTALLRDRPGRLGRGFVLRDGRYLSGRWPGDAHAFGTALSEALG